MQGHGATKTATGGRAAGLSSARDRARLRERERAERARVERMLARGPRPAELEREARAGSATGTAARAAVASGCACRVCGGRELIEDEVFDRGAWRVARCLRCDHRSMERVAARFKPAVRRPLQAGVERCANGA